MTGCDEVDDSDDVDDIEETVLDELDELDFEESVDEHDSVFIRFAVFEFEKIRLENGWLFKAEPLDEQAVAICPLDSKSVQTLSSLG